MKVNHIVHVVATVLVIVGGINWGLVGVWDYNLVGALLGDGTGIARIVYGLVGLSAVYLAVVSVYKKVE